jgi:hypothetical protein
MRTVIALLATAIIIAITLAMKRYFGFETTLVVLLTILILKKG